jgi:probable phosphoglycerate mutase
VLVYLIRHGETDLLRSGLCGRLPGISLNETGHNQARLIAAYLKEQPIVAIYSSPLERAMETALPLAQSKGLEIRPAPAFNEVNHGDWAGMTWEQLHLDPRWRAHNEFRSGVSAPNGEMAVEVEARAVKELERLLAQHGEDQIAVVTHAAVVRATVTSYLGVPIDLSQRMEVDPASISIVELNQYGPRILSTNRTL